jgi:hypothetical protein
MKILKTEALAFEGKGTGRGKIVVSNKTLEYMLNFNYLGYTMRYNKYNDTNMKLSFKTYVVLYKELFLERPRRRLSIS